MWEIFKLTLAATVYVLLCLLAVVIAILAYALSSQISIPVLRGTVQFCAVYTFIHNLIDGFRASMELILEIREIRIEQALEDDEMGKHLEENLEENKEKKFNKE